MPLVSSTKRKRKDHKYLSIRTRCRFWLARTEFRIISRNRRANDSPPPSEDLSPNEPLFRPPRLDKFQRYPLEIYKKRKTDTQGALCGGPPKSHRQRYPDPTAAIRTITPSCILCFSGVRPAPCASFPASAMINVRLSSKFAAFISITRFSQINALSSNLLLHFNYNSNKNIYAPHACSFFQVELSWEEDMRINFSLFRGHNDQVRRGKVTGYFHNIYTKAHY